MNAKELIMQQPREVREKAILDEERIHIPTTLFVNNVNMNVDLSDPNVCENMKSLMIVLRGKGKKKRTIGEMLSKLSR